MKRVVIYCEGPNEHGGRCDEDIQCDQLPPLPCLIHRLAGDPAETVYRCREFKTVGHTRVGAAGASTWAKKVIRACQEASSEGYDAIIIVVDQDRDRDRLPGLREGRRRSEILLAAVRCAVGTAIETFDAWMIADPNAIEDAEGDKCHAHPAPEKLDGKEGSGNHPKEWASRAFGGQSSLTGSYAEVAKHVDLDHLRRCCPRGFDPFAREVEETLRPLFEAE